MTEFAVSTHPGFPSNKANVAGQLFVLDSSGGRIVSLNADGSYPTVIVTECRRPDGIAIDSEAGHIYWTNVGVPILNAGSIERADFDGGNRKTIFRNGGTFTPRKLRLDEKGGKLYWADREGMRVMRSNLDGSEIETLVRGVQGYDDRRAVSGPCTGIAVDATRGHLFWTQKGPDDAAQGPNLSRKPRNP